MLVAVIRRGLRDQSRAPLTWGGALGVMGALFAALWPSIEGSMSKLLDSYPAGLKEAFGIQRLDSAIAYIDAELLSLIAPFALTFFAVRSIARATVGAAESGYADTILSLPLSRRALVAASYATTGIVLAAILAVVWSLTFLAGALAGAGVGAAPLAAGLLNVWPLAMAFAGLAALACGFLRRSAVITGVATGSLVAMYVVDLLGKLTDAMAPFRPASAFRYYGSAAQHGLDLSHITTLIVAGVILAWAGAILFERRDIG
jgi:ABC-2 type transport system permease protein